MPERSYIHSCPVCCTSLDVSLDTMTETIKIRPENLPPLARDLVSVVSVYKRVKKLGPSWEAKHMARAMVNAGELLVAVGYHGGQLERATGLLEWLAESGKDFNLETAATYFGEYSAILEAKKTFRKCCECHNAALPGALVCREHSWCYRCDDAGNQSEKRPEELVAEKSTGHPIYKKCCSTT